MGFVIVFLILMFVIIPIALALTLPLIPANPKVSRAKLAEIKVSEALSRLNLKSYVIFENIVLPSNGNTAHTEIDHVVVSPYGIFCIETKSHCGAIYAYKNNKTWAQYLAGKKYDFHSSLRQNYKHVKAIEAIIGADFKAPVHSYVVFPYAQKLVTDSNFVYDDVNYLLERIARHTQPVYNLEECTRILKALAYASSQKEALSAVHAQEVQSYLRTQ